MVDSVAALPPGFRIVDANGTPVPGAKIYFYAAGTTTPYTVYSDSSLSTSLGAVVYTDSGGRPVASEGSSTGVTVYVGTSAYKIIVLDADDDTVIPALDNLKGALNTSTFLTTGSTSTLTIPVISKTANYTILAADNSKLIQGNATGGNFTLTLTAAATLGDGWSCEVRNSGTSGQVILAASEAIAFEGGSFTYRALEIGEAMAIRCDGTAFKVVSHTAPLMASRGPSVIQIVDRVTSAPSGPTPGARYIVQTGFSSYATGDIIEANSSSFNKYTPPTDCGWIAYVQDENRYYSYQDSAWVLGLDPAASDSVAGLIELAVQSEMEAATDTGRAVTPATQKYHPGHPKAWINLNGTGTIAIRASHNVASITDNGSGDYTVNFTTVFSAATYALAGMAQRSASNNDCFVCVKQGATPTASACNIGSTNAGALEDAPIVCVAFLGDFA